MGVPPPSGTVTFLFTDVVGSTGLWEVFPEAMGEAIARHDGLLHAAIDARDVYVFAAGGDGLAAAFARAGDAVRAAIDAQAALLAEESSIRRSSTSRSLTSPRRFPTPARPSSHGC
jgi:class 3 adenylate cyclase